MVFKTTVPLLPTTLAEADLAERLFVFAADNQARLNRIVHDRGYLEHPERLSRVAGEFLQQVVAVTLERGETGGTREKARGDGKTYRFSGPGLDTDFPYRDDDD